MRSVAARIPRRAQFRLVILLVMAVASPVAADVFQVESRARVHADSSTNSVGASNNSPQGVDFTAFDESITAESEGGQARGSQNTTIVQSTESLHVDSRSDNDAFHEHAGASEVGFTGAAGASFLDVEFCVDERSSFSVSGSVSVETNGSQNSSDATFRFEEIVFAQVKDVKGSLRSTSFGRTGVLAPGCYDFRAVADAAVKRSNQTASRTSVRFTFDVQSSPQGPDGDVFRWRGPKLGAFGDEGNWDPSGVPAFLVGTRSDTALFQGILGVRVDIAALAAVTNGAPGLAVPRAVIPQCSGVITRTIGRLVLDGAREIALQNGTLALDALSLDDRALTVKNRGGLELRDGALCARHAVIGALGGPSTALVTAPGVLQTLGRLSVAQGGEGTLRVTDGGIASSQEVRIGDGQARGTAVVSNATWTTGNIGVGFQSAGDLTVENAGLLESEIAFVGSGMATGSPPQQPSGFPLCLGRPNAGGAIVRGAGSTWKLNQLQIGGRGCVNVAAGGHVDAVPGNDFSGQVFVGTDSAGEGSLFVNDGGVVDTEAAMLIGGGRGRLVITEQVGKDTRVDVNGELLIGGFDPGGATGGRGLVIVNGDPGTDEFSLVANSMEIPEAAGARGELQIGFGGRVLTSTTADVGTVGFGVVELNGVAAIGAPEQITRWQIGDTLTIGSDGVQTTGIVIIKDAGITVGTLSTPGHVIIQAGGEVFGTGNQINLIRTFGGMITNHGKISGPVTLDGRYDPASTGQIVQTLAAAPAAPPQTAFLDSGQPRAKAPPFPQGPVVFTGDAELAGTLVLQFLNGFAPKQGATVPVFEVGGQVIGSFDAVQIVGLAPGATFDAVEDGAATPLADTVALPVVTLKAPKKVKEKLGGKAKVQLKRAGNVAQPLSVHYALGGTATNGLDYATLSGVVEIPAGKKSATLLLRAFADGLFEDPETIEIEVLPGEDYAPALPAKASVQLLSGEKQTK